MGGSPAASPYMPAETYSSIFPYSYMFAMAMDTVHVYAGLGAASPAPAYIERAPAAPTRASSSTGSAPEESRETPRAGPEPYRAGDGRISVSLSRAEALEAEPGKIITARFMVTNNTDEEVALQEVLNYPADWVRVAAAAPEFSVAGRTSAMRLATFHIPPNCPAGAYEFLYEVMDPLAPALGGETSFSVTVLPQFDLGSTVIRAPRTAVAGTEFTLEVAFKNRGNTKAVATVRASARPDYKVSVDPVDLLIPSGAARTVRIGVKTDSDAMQKRMCTVIVEATVLDEEGQTSIIKEVVTVEVIPRVTRLDDPYYRLPSWVRLTIAADGENAAMQAEVSGSGSIAGDKSRNLSYVLRQTSSPRIGRYASWDEYWLSYRSSHMEVNIGDRVFMLSPLVQRFYYGRGAGAGVMLRNVALGAYYARSRSEDPLHREAGGYVSVEVKRGLSVKANVLDKHDESYLAAAGSRHLIASVQANYAPYPNSRFEIEYGVADEEGSGNDGYRFAANGAFARRLYYSLEKVHAGPRFYGYTNDSDFSIGTLQYPVRPGVTLRLHYRSHAGNLDLNPLKLTANTEQQVTAGVSYIATPRTRLNFELQDFSRRDRLDTPQYDFGERTVRVSVGYSVPLFSLYLTGEHGYSHNDLLDSRTSLGRYSVSASYRPSSRQSYNIYGGFGNNRYSEVPRKSDNLGLAGRWHITQNLNMNLDFHVSGSPSIVENAYRILTNSLDYMLPNRHVLTLKTSLWGGRDGNRGDASVLLSYSIPAPIPLGRKKTLGTIKGRIFDAEDEPHSGVPDVIVTADGQAAVTDAKGEFEFPSLAPGVYSLQVDARSIGLGRVTQARSPFVVVVTGGKTARLDLGVVRSATISGEVLMIANEPAEASDGAETSDRVLVGLGKGRGMPTHANGLPDVLVEISNGEDHLTQYTSSGGAFAFTGLRPGTWTVRIYPEDLPHYYFVEAEESRVEVAAGDEAHLELKILPRQRRINIMDEGDIKTESR